ncbi:AI-2E family transporter [Aureimonas mangrovi]|uniref:AI-2E family transporter n=1 Tax=Aureimonas mangrovi TaxID=2758041 RepID=UPI00163D4126|nr:AI-2E family transporter [Aureimonas mangrovi]
MSVTPTKSEIARRTVVVTSIVLAFLLIATVIYASSTAFFLLFAALILAAIFDGLASLLGRLGVPRKVGLILVFLLTLVGLAALFFFGGATLFQQGSRLVQAVVSQAESLLTRAQEAGLPIDLESINAQSLGNMLPAPGGIVASAGNALFALGGAFGNIFVIFFLAAFSVWEPGVYKRGFLSLLPRDKRQKVSNAIDDGAQNLKMWLLGQGFSMLTVFVVSWFGLWLIGMPYAFLLALQAGLLAFVPTIGAFAAGVPIILTGLSVSPSMALWGLGVYVLIQGAESNISTPIAQRWATSLPPALTLTVQLVFGILFGLGGFILAVPLMAVIMVIVQRLYVEDTLGGGVPSPRD